MISSPLLLKRWLFEAFGVGAAAGEVYFAAVEAVLVFHIAVLAERRILLIPAAVFEYISSAVPVAVKVAAILVTIEISAVIKSALAVESATFLAFPFAFEAILARFPLRLPTILAAFAESTTFVPVIAPTILDFLFFRA